MRALAYATVIFFPASYALKFILDLETTWVDPAFVTGALALAIYVIRRKGRIALTPGERRTATAAGVFLLVYCIAGLLALLRYVCTYHGIAPTTYACVRHPAWLALCVALFYLVLVAANDRRFYQSILRLFVWVGIGELLLALYTLAALARGWYLPQTWAAYMEAYYWRQAVYQGGAIIPRLGGTFLEAPIYGLFMLCALVSNLLLLRLGARRLYKVTLALLLLGTIGSLSDQVLLGLAALPVFVFLPGLVRHTRRRPLALVGGMMVVIGLATWVGLSIHRKSQLESPQLRVGGQSMSERVYHAAYGLDRAEEHPLIGIGPGMYGYYVEKTGFFPHTATVMFTLPEILAETGVIGLASFLIFVSLTGWWLWRRRDGIGFGAFVSLLAASSLQSNWKWGFLYFTFGLVIAYYRFAPAGPETSGDKAPCG